MGRLVRLEVENFKSYSGKQQIGPFADNFVSVIGPNGAGKSNLMDALSFVLGVQSVALRSKQLNELIFRSGEMQASFASVGAVYEKDGVEMVFGRRVSAAGVSEYRLDGRTVSYADYVRVWEGENVLIKARNFLVFQGDVEAMASKSPKELTRLFEQISGSEEHCDEYERCKVRDNGAIDY
jgi:structural maintenance of chromosome 1